MSSVTNFIPYRNSTDTSFNSFGIHSEIVLQPKSVIRIGDTVTTTEELELFVKVARRLLKDSYHEELV